MHRSRAAINVPTGQYSSHLVYCSSSLFLQQREGHEEGHAQQHKMNGLNRRIAARPKRKGPIKNANCLMLSFA